MVRAVLALLWTLIVLYPDPRLLVASIERAWHPVLDPAAVRELAASLPDDPRAIEAIVTTELIAYATPWETYGVPWYFPTPTAALARGEGDCQARAVVLASILRAKGIPATLVGSFDHLWVDYPGKWPNQMENRQVALVVQQPDNGYRLHWPRLIEWRQSWEIERAYFWDAMPRERFRLLLGGWLLLGVQPRRVWRLYAATIPSQYHFRNKPYRRHS